MATTTRARAGGRANGRANGQPGKLTRDEVAKRMVPILGDEPMSAVEIAERLGLVRPNGKLNNDLVLDAANVAFSRRQARRIPDTAGSPQGGWVRWDSPLQVSRDTASFKWPYERIEWVPIGKIGVDPRFQRALTTYVSKIERGFDPEQFEPLILNDRGARHEREHGWRYSAVDGQTRWVAVGNLGALEVPAVVYKNLPYEREAGLFWRRQKNRRNVVSTDTFRAQVEEGDPTAVAVKKLVKKCGFEIGDRHGQIKAPAALVSCYRADPELLEEVLIDFRESWKARDIVPESGHLKGLFYFCRFFPIEDRDEALEVDHDQLVRRLKSNGPVDLEKKVASVKDLHPNYKGDKLIGAAFQAMYETKR